MATLREVTLDPLLVQIVNLLLELLFKNYFVLLAQRRVKRLGLFWYDDLLFVRAKFFAFCD